MVERHLSMRGEVVDFNKLRLRNSDKPALGNASMNAKGDIIGQDGLVIKTQEQVEAEWAARIAEQQEVSTTVDLKNANAMAVAASSDPIKHPTQAPVTKVTQTAPGLGTKEVDLSDMDFDPESESKNSTAPAPKARRKIVESD